MIRGLSLIFAITLLSAPALSQVRSGPAWSELSSSDKQLLAPLQQDWDKWDLLRKNKWLQMAKKYPTLPAAEQVRIRDQMEGWAKLSTQERQAAREKFKGLTKLPPEQRKDLNGQWQEYQSLPQEERQALRRSAPSKGGTAGPGSTPTVAGQPAGAPPGQPANPGTAIAQPSAAAPAPAAPARAASSTPGPTPPR